jgi:hypothetical protein
VDRQGSYTGGRRRGLGVVANHREVPLPRVAGQRSAAGRRRRGTLSPPVFRCSPAGSSWTASRPGPVTRLRSAYWAKHPQLATARGVSTLDVLRGCSGAGSFDKLRKIGRRQLSRSESGPLRPLSNRRERSKGRDVVTRLLITGSWASPDRRCPSTSGRCRLPRPVPITARRRQRARVGRDQAANHCQPDRGA